MSNPKAKTTSKSKIILDVKTQKPTNDNITFIVTGKLTKSDSTVVSDAVVEVFNKLLRSEVLLADSITDSTGSYEISFSNSVAPDITVRVFDKNKKVIASAGPFFRIPLKKTVDLVLDNKPYKGPTGYKILSDKVAEKLESNKLSSLSDNELKILSGKTGISTAKLTSLKNAEVLSDKNGISKDFIYGLIDSNFKADTYSLAIQPDKILTNTIKKAADKNIISENEAVDATIASNIEKLRIGAAKETLAKNDLHTSMYWILHYTKLTDKLKEKFLVTLYKNSNNYTKTYEELKTDKNFKTSLLDNVKGIFEIGSLTLNYAGMVNAINKKLNTATPLSSFSVYSKDDWKKFIKDNKTSVPQATEGKNWQEKFDSFSKMLTKNFEKAFPGEKVKRKLLKDNPDDNIKKFFNAAPDFDIGKTNIYSYLKKNEATLKPKVNDYDALGKELKSWQRLYRITPEEDKYEKMTVLKNAKLDSAFKISKYSSKDDFTEEFKVQVGGDEAANKNKKQEKNGILH